MGSTTCSPHRTQHAAPRSPGAHSAEGYAVWSSRRRARQQGELAQHQRRATASLPMAEVGGVPAQQMEAVGKQLHHAGMAQHAALHTLGRAVCMQACSTTE